MRGIIYFFYTVSFFITVLVFSFGTSYLSWYFCNKYKVNFVYSYFDTFPSLEHWGVIVGIPLLFRKIFLKFSYKQATFFYKNYVEQFVFTKYLLINFFIYFLLFMGILMLCWGGCDYLSVNLFEKYYDRPFSVEHYITALLITLFTYRPLIQDTKKISEKSFFKYYETKGRLISSETRAYVKKRDKGKCQQCGSKRKLEYDHIKPHSKGGSNRVHNIQLLCMKCNREKSDAY